MPNFVKTIIHTSSDVVEEIKKKYCEDGIFTFQKVIPRPRFLDLESGSKSTQAILYAYVMKDSKGKEEILNKVKNRSLWIQGDIISTLAENSKQDLAEFVLQYQDYIPTSEEKELKICSFENLGDRYIQNIQDYGTVDWYDWNTKNWGTKWDVIRFENDAETLTFETAWNCPVPILEELSNIFPKNIMHVLYADEDYGSNFGMILLHNGIKSHEKPPYNSEKFAEEIWNYCCKEETAEIKKVQYEVDGGRIPLEERDPTLFYYALRSWDSGPGYEICRYAVVNHIGNLITDKEILHDKELIEDGDKFLNEYGIEMNELHCNHEQQNTMELVQELQGDDEMEL